MATVEADYAVVYNTTGAGLDEIEDKNLLICARALYNSQDRAMDLIACRNLEIWLQQRRTFITASEVPMIFGCGFKSAFWLFSYKTGLIEDTDQDKEVFYWGHALEDDIAERYSRETARRIEDPGDYTLITDPTGPAPWLAATLDRMVYDPETQTWGILELKNRGFYCASDWEYGVPEDVNLQVQVQLLCSGLQWGSVAVLLGGNTFKWFDVQRDDEKIAEIVERTEEFRARIENNEPPDVDDSASTKVAVSKLHEDDTGEIIPAPDWFLEVDMRLEDIKAQAKALKKEEGTLTNRIRQAITDEGATFLASPRVQYSLKTQVSKVGIKVDPAQEQALLDAEIPYEVTGGTKAKVLRRHKAKR